MRDAARASSFRLKHVANRLWRLIGGRSRTCDVCARVVLVRPTAARLDCLNLGQRNDSLPPLRLTGVGE
jgi:hypothetical protein